MNLKGLSGGQYQPLSKEQIKTIHEASLTILEKTGVTYESGIEQTLEILEQAGLQSRFSILKQAKPDPPNLKIYIKSEDWWIKRYPDESPRNGQKDSRRR